MTSEQEDLQGFPAREEPQLFPEEEEEEESGGFTLEETQARLNDYAERLGIYVPNPTQRRLLDGETDYTPDDLASMLQEYGAYISNLSALKGRMEADHNILEKGFRFGMKIGLGGFHSDAGTVSGREADFLNSEPGERFRTLQSQIILSESCLMLLNGWLKSYESAYTSVSRVVTVKGLDAQVASGRYS